MWDYLICDNQQNMETLVWYICDSSIADGRQLWSQTVADRYRSYGNLAYNTCVESPIHWSQTVANRYRSYKNQAQNLKLAPLLFQSKYQCCDVRFQCYHQKTKKIRGRNNCPWLLAIRLTNFYGSTFVLSILEFIFMATSHKHCTFTMITVFYIYRQLYSARALKIV